MLPLANFIHESCIGFQLKNPLVLAQTAVYHTHRGFKPHLLLTIPEAGQSKIKVPSVQDQEGTWGKPSNLQTARLLLCPQHDGVSLRESMRELSFHNDTNPVMGTPTLVTLSRPPKSHTSKHHHCRTGASPYEFGRGVCKLFSPWQHPGPHVRLPQDDPAGWPRAPWRAWASWRASPDCRPGGGLLSPGVKSALRLTERRRAAPLRSYTTLLSLPVSSEPPGNLSPSWWFQSGTWGLWFFSDHRYVFYCYQPCFIPVWIFRLTFP